MPIQIQRASVGHPLESIKEYFNFEFQLGHYEINAAIIKRSQASKEIE